MDKEKPSFVKNFDELIYYCKGCIGGFICSIIFSSIPLIALFSHEMQSDPTGRILYSVMSIAFYLFSIILSVVGLHNEKKARRLFKTKCREMGIVGIIISTIGIITCICLIIASTI